MRALAILAIVAALGGAARADDGEVESEKMQFLERGSTLTVTTRIKQLFDAKTFANLDTGIPSTVVIRMWVYPKDSNDPVAFQLLQRSAAYDVWDEVYIITLDDAGGRKTVRVKYRAEALKLLTEIDDLPVARTQDIGYDKIFQLALHIELNPVSKETLAEVRRWLTQGNGGGLDRGGSFFGSFVSVFVNPKIPEADRVLRIRSQPFFRPKPK